MSWQIAAADLLATLIGLDVTSVGQGVIDSAIRKRMAATGVDSPADYLAQLGTSRTEQCALVEEVVVPESWFFRDRRPFSRLQEHVRTRPTHGGSDHQLRILSLPCAGGEEAYSIAIALREIGVTAEQVHIDAVDVSSRALDRARRGVFGPHAFRGPSFCDTSRYFRPLPNGWELTADVRAQVHFHEGNLLDAGLLAGQPAYDVVFCRNLLIYLTSTARRRAMTVLDRLLADDGILFVGHAEALSLLEPSFSADADKGSFAYRRAATVAPPPPPSLEPVLPTGRASWPPVVVPPAPAVRFERATPMIAVAPAPTPTALLEEAAELANRHEHDQAIRLCEQALHQAGPQPRIFVLLGMIELARRETDRAEENLLKAVYLDGKNDEALLALALICEQRGDHEAAARYQRRAERARHTKERS